MIFFPCITARDIWNEEGQEDTDGEGEKMMNIFKEQKRVIPALQVLLAVFMMVSYAFPYGKYVYKKGAYHMSALDYLFGKNIAGGSVDIEPQRLFTLFIIAAILFTAAAGIHRFKSEKAAGIMTMTGGAVAAAVPIIFMYNFNTVMGGAKKTGVLYGPYITMFFGVLALVLGFYILYRCKTLNVLDIMVIPGLIYLIINNYIPMSGIVIAFKSLNYSQGAFNSPWCGLENFEFLFQNKDIWNIIRNTIGYNVVFIILNNLFGIAVGIMLSEAVSKVFQRVSQTLILLPQIISWVIVAYMVYGLFSTNTGWINNTLLPLFGYDGPNIAFYGTRKYWPFILTFVAVWKGLGYNSIIYLSSIIGIDRNLYEAAYIDGCSKLKQIRHITLPLLKPTVIILVIMALGHIMNSNFGLFYQTTQNSGALYPVTQTLDVYVYRSIMETQNLSMGAAAAALQSIVGFCLIMIANTAIRKFDSDNALF